jgi:response regulator RpfG family c-di-GMP phosphodiesterase/serine/threonine protein kinase
MKRPLPAEGGTHPPRGAPPTLPSLMLSGDAALFAAAAPLSSTCRTFLDSLLELRLLAPPCAVRFLDERDDQIAGYITPLELGNALVSARLLTSHQVTRVLSGKTHGLLLGSYRVLDRLGAGGMGTVFLGEHVLMKRRVAIKVLPVDEDCPASVRQRFYAEMRVLADLHHPHIVLAFDAGELPPAGPNMPHLIYLVMELMPGGDLEEYVLDHGPRPIAQACEWVRQAASALQQTHDHHVIHRDVKPSNLLLSALGQVKMVDFGLVRQFSSTLTDHRSLLGSIEFMAPEQSHDPSAVRAAADIYGLGATLFWLLTGEPPYPTTRLMSAALKALQQEPPRRLRALCPDAPVELEALLDQIMARDPSRRPAMPLAVMNALMPFTVASSDYGLPLTHDVPPTACAPEIRVAPFGGPEVPLLPRSGSTPGSGLWRAMSSPHQPQTDLGPSRRVLLVDDEEAVRHFMRTPLQLIGCLCAEAKDGEQALEMARAEPYDLMLLDLNLPGIDGFEVCRRLREHPPRPHFKVVFISGMCNHDSLVEGLLRGADDYIPKPFSSRQLEAKVRHALHLKDVQDRVDSLARQVLLTNLQLEQSLLARAADVRQAQDALLFAMAKMAESRDGETPGHLRRLQRYTRCLAERVVELPPWSGLVDTRFLEQLERCVPLHDIGKIGLPDDVLLKPGALNAVERALVQTHPLIGDSLLDALGQEYGGSLEFLGTARAIVRHHHERHDGRGYPDRLAGEAIPAAARLVALADVYDALRRQRLYKAALPHDQAAHLLLHDSRGQFDPLVLQAFAGCQAQFERIFREVGE